MQGMGGSGRPRMGVLEFELEFEKSETEKTKEGP